MPENVVVLELAYLALIQRNVMRYRNLLVIANSFPTNCEMYVVNIYLQTEVTFYKDNAEPQKGVNTSALTLWFVNSDGF